MSTNHILTVEYFNTDDGIWLVCQRPGCFHERNLGFSPTTAEIANAAREHRDEAKRAANG